MHKIERWKRTAVVFLMTVAFIFTTSVFQVMAQEQEKNKNINAESMIIDFLLLRPLGVAVTAVGTVVFIGSLPFSVTGGNTKLAFKKLVEEPATYTFTRPLGKLENETGD
ncbi:MAG: hypothetical protein ABII26_02055 [Pseudomonadota bacterium]